MGSKSDWIPIAESEALQKANCYFFDLPGHGESLIRNKKMSFEYLIQLLCQFIEQEKIVDPIFVGYSMGGRVALSLALECYKTVGVRGVLLESASLGIIDEKLRHERFLQDQKLLLPFCSMTREFLDRWYSASLFKGIKECEGFSSQFERMLLNDIHELQLALTLLSVGTFEPIDAKEISFPVKYLCGLDDEKYFGIGKYIQRMNLPFWEVISVPRCSHNIHLQNKNLFIDMLSSLIQNKNSGSK